MLSDITIHDNNVVLTTCHLSICRIYEIDLESGTPINMFSLPFSLSRSLFLSLFRTRARLPSLSRNVSLHSRKRMDLVTIMRGRSSPVDGRSVRRVRRNRRYFFPSSKADRSGRGEERREEGGGGVGGGENNLKAELNFSSSESFVRALGGGQ